MSTPQELYKKVQEAQDEVFKVQDLLTEANKRLEAAKNAYRESLPDCHICNGTGRDRPKHWCDMCDGIGKIRIR